MNLARGLCPCFPMVFLSYHYSRNVTNVLPGCGIPGEQLHRTSQIIHDLQLRPRMPLMPCISLT